jgi:hypothetical protein
MTDSPYQSCIDACLECAVACDHCAMACLQEEDVNKMARCISLDTQCAAVCRVAAQLMALNSDHAAAFCQVCADVCHDCAEECGRHDMQHCRDCAVACRRCMEECAAMAAA